jgi:hypothetical protein
MFYIKNTVIGFSKVVVILTNAAVRTIICIGSAVFNIFITKIEPIMISSVTCLTSVSVGSITIAKSYVLIALS